MLSIEMRCKYLKHLGLYQGEIVPKENEELKKSYLKLQKKYFKRPQDIDGKYGKDTDKLLVSAYRVSTKTKNFNLTEFACPCVKKGLNYCTGYPATLNVHMLENMQRLRDEMKKPITITCGLRCEKYNASKSNSITASLHMKGCANDLYIPGISDTVAGRKSLIRRWMRYPHSNYGYQGTLQMGNATHLDVK